MHIGERARLLGELSFDFSDLFGNCRFAIGAGLAGNTGDDNVTAQVGVAFGF